MVATKKSLKKGVMQIVSWLIFIVVSGFIVILMERKCDLFYAVEGTSMEPTLHDSQIVFSNGKSFELGDIVVANIPESFLEEYPEYENHLVIKRLIGVPNDEIEITEEGIYVNGKLLTEDYVSEENFPYTYQENGKNKVVLAEDEYFLMGDNRKVSFDSRTFGPAKDTDLLYEQSEKPTREFYFKLVLTIAALGAWFLLHSVIESIIEKRRGPEI